MAFKTISEIVQSAENKFNNGTTTKSKYVSFSLSENLDKIDAYANSKHTTGDKDSKGRDKPFFDITTAAINIWYRATDIDRRNMRIKATKREDVLKAFIATVHLQEYMRRENFGRFLNKWGRSLAKYGSSIVKLVDKGDRLHTEVVPWNKLIVDPIDAMNNPIIEILELTPAQLRKNKGYDQEIVEGLIKSEQATRKTRDGQAQDTRADYIKLYEVHGELPLSHITDDPEDDTIYVQQMHVISMVESKDGEIQDFSLVKGKEKNPYLLTHLIEEEGQTLSIGSVQHLFEAQWMMNHSQKAIKDQLDLASKVIFQTSDGNYVGRNVLNAIDNGEILIHAPNQPITQVNNNSHDITALMNFQSQWQSLAKEINSTPDAISGNTFPSGTAYRQVVALQQEAHSLFEQMTESKGLHLEEMLRIHIIPYIKKKMNSTDEIAATLDEQGIQKIDTIYIPNQAVRQANQKILAEALKGNPLTQEAGQELVNAETQDITKKLALDGDQRFLKPSEIASKTWADELDGFEWDVEVEITNESTNKEATMTTLTTVLQTIAGNPGVLQDPNMKMLFNKILTTSGEVSPIELSATPAQPTQSPEQLEELQAVGGE